MYMQPCWYCGGEIECEAKVSEQRTFHPDCQIKFQTEQDELRKTYSKYRSELMFQRALNYIDRQSEVYASEYYDEADVVHDMAIKQPGKFDSSDEMLAAMELLRNRIHVKVQYKINRRRVDFLIPELHVALEIDGAIHRFKIQKDSEREVEIMNKLRKEHGGEWEVIRIPTSLIEKNITKLVPAIKILYKARQSLRKGNGGFLPSYWSRTNRFSQIKALNGVDDETIKTLDYYDDEPKEL